jgi:hypothetical protein
LQLKQHYRAERHAAGKSVDLEQKRYFQDRRCRILEEEALPSDLKRRIMGDDPSQRRQREKGRNIIACFHEFTFPEVSSTEKAAAGDAGARRPRIPGVPASLFTVAAIRPTVVPAAVIPARSEPALALQVLIIRIAIRPALIRICNIRIHRRLKQSHKRQRESNTLR